MVPIEGFRKEVIFLPNLFVKGNTLSRARFESCRLTGPGVMAWLGSTNVVNCTFPGPLEAFFWEVGPDRPMVFGPMAFVDCEFIGCTFDETLGLAGPPEVRRSLEQQSAAS